MISAGTCLILNLSIVKYDAVEEMDLQTMMTGSCNPEKYQKIFQNEIYKKAVTLWLPFLNKRGFLDALIKSDEIENNLKN